MVAGLSTNSAMSQEVISFAIIENAYQSITNSSSVPFTMDIGVHSNFVYQSITGDAWISATAEAAAQSRPQLRQLNSGPSYQYDPSLTLSSLSPGSSLGKAWGMITNAYTKARPFVKPALDIGRLLLPLLTTTAPTEAVVCRDFELDLLLCALAHLKRSSVFSRYE